MTVLPPAEEVVVQREKSSLTISAPQAGILRLTGRREVSRSRDEIVTRLSEIDIAADDFDVVIAAMRRWRWTGPEPGRRPPPGAAEAAGLSESDQRERALARDIGELSNALGDVGRPQLRSRILRAAKNLAAWRNEVSELDVWTAVARSLEHVSPSQEEG